MTQTDHTVSPSVAGIGRLLQLFVYAPLGAGTKLIEDGPAAIGKARQELTNARFIGKLVVTQGEARLRERLAARSADDPPAEQSSSGDARSDPGSDSAGGTTEIPALDPDEIGPEPGGLALPDYDHLPAIDIVGQLDSLSADELDQIDEYERRNRRRRTVLGKIAQLRDSS